MPLFGLKRNRVIPYKGKLNCLTWMLTRVERGVNEVTAGFKEVRRLDESRAAAWRFGRGDDDYGWKPFFRAQMSQSELFQPILLFEMRQTAPSRAIRGNSISVNSTLSAPLLMMIADATCLPYSALSAYSVKYVLPFWACKTTKNSPQSIPDGGKIWQVGATSN